MNRITFLKSLFTPLLAPLLSKQKPEILRLNDDYYRAANNLTDYRHKNGFEPGVRVRAQYRDDPPKFGVIAGYGDAWQCADHYCVPVRLDSGVLQPWPMSDLKIISRAGGPEQ